MLADFIRYLEAERRYSPLTVRNYRRDVENFMACTGMTGGHRGQKTSEPWELKVQMVVSHHVSAAPGTQIGRAHV